MHPFVKRFAVAMSLLLGIVPVAEAQQDLWRGGYDGRALYGPRRTYRPFLQL